MSINILGNISRLQTNLQSIDAPLVLVENYVKGAIHAFNQSMDVFWNLPDEELLEVLNHQGPLAVLGSETWDVMTGQVTEPPVKGIFPAHAEYAGYLNLLLEERGISEPRAVIGMRKQITLNPQGLFEIVPAPEPEPEPEPEPGPSAEG